MMQREAMIWLRQMAHDLEVKGLNTGTVYWMYVSDLLAITLKKIENKGSQMGHTQKNDEV
jgi:hypothetical protein